MKQNKGFTLIELLVVIAIIGILSSVVLASLTTARTKGQDAAVQQQLASMRSQAELYYSSNGNAYAASALGAASAANCTGSAPFNSTGTGGMNNLVQGVIKLGVTPTCTASSTGWAVYSPLPSNPGWGFCVDNSGKAATSTGINGAGCI